MKEFKFTEEDLHNLYDVLDIATLSEIFKDTLKLNKLDKWFWSFFNRLDAVVIPEITGGEE
jgi:hypothetical protein